MDREINAATDNPLIFDDGAGGYVSISGGHFHGQYVAQAMDILALSDDRPRLHLRTPSRPLVDPTLSYGLPRNLLAGKRGLNTGFATVQCSMSALVMENRTLSMPGSVDSIPGKSNAEDHVSNSTWCGPKGPHGGGECRDDRRRRTPDGGAGAVARWGPIAGDHRSAAASRRRSTPIRAVIPPALDGDRWYATEMNQAIGLVRSGAVLDAVEAKVGALE